MKENVELNSSQVISVFRTFLKNLKGCEMDFLNVLNKSIKMPQNFFGMTGFFKETRFSSLTGAKRIRCIA